MARAAQRAAWGRGRGACRQHFIAELSRDFSAVSKRQAMATRVAVFTFSESSSAAVTGFLHLGDLSHFWATAGSLPLGRGAITPPKCRHRTGLSMPGSISENAERFVVKTSVYGGERLAFADNQEGSS